MADVVIRQLSSICGSARRLLIPVSDGGRPDLAARSDFQGGWHSSRPAALYQGLGEGIIARRTGVRKWPPQACFPAFRRPQNRDRRRIARTYGSRERAWPSVTAPPAATATPATNGLVSNALVSIPIHWNGRRHAMDWYPMHWSPLHTNGLHPQPRRRPDTRPGKTQTSHGVVSLQFQ